MGTRVRVGVLVLAGVRGSCTRGGRRREHAPEAVPGAAAARIRSAAGGVRGAGRRRCLE